MAGEKYIALEETSQAIKETVDGVKTDTAGIVLSNASIKAIVDEIQNRIGVTGDTGGSIVAGTAMAKLNKILEKTGNGTTEKIIKHIQRGHVIADSSTDSSGTVTLAGFTNLEKMVAILNGDAFLGSGKYSGIYLKELTLTSLSTLPSRGGSYSYQVIEFY